MAVFRTIQAIKIWFFCIRVKLYYLPDTTVAYKFCNGIKIPHWSACSHDVDCIINDLAKEMTSQVWYGYAVCEGHLLCFDCHLCLVNAASNLTNGCPDNTALVGAAQRL
ncbi:hypothetical protein ACJRO7_025966 [Eucalyptus globulus]|uniref:Uncharacterized protein n=1 Tax=Eucalyptus globulus TaxID=34317 RepID=A0ABD3KJ91_EUCGL